MQWSQGELHPIFLEGGNVPRNTNGNPFAYEMWIDTVYADEYSLELDYFIRLTDIDEDSPSFETSITYNIQVTLLAYQFDTNYS